MDSITNIKNLLGNDLAVMAHHYQHDEVVAHADHTGDSLELARIIPSLDAKYIMFCGVFFMAETAAMLVQDGQQAYTPAPDAGCIMSNMAPAHLAEQIFTRLTRNGRKLIPLAYVNSSAAVKALCGAHGGTVCTSANASKMLRWALDQGDGVLFLPDKNLALNTAHSLGLDAGSVHQLNIQGFGRRMDLEAADKAELLVWPGCCAIHNRFKTAHIDAVRTASPDAKIIVHPECTPEVVQASDANGSTSTIIKYVADAPEGATVVIGTEINLVRRLALQYEGVKNVRALFPSGCANMAKTTAARLADALAALPDPRVAHMPAPEMQAVTVDEDVAANARVALERMLEVCA